MMARTRISEFSGRKVREVAALRGSSGFLRQAQDRLFALERRAQDDSKNRQRQVRNAGILRYAQNDKQEQA
jgi:hypothetical protein